MTEKKTALRDEAVEKLKDLIMSREYPSGTPIREVDISKALNISRVPVREAFRILEQEGIVEYIPNCGVRVKTFTKSDIENIYQVRLMIDTFIADEVLANIAENDLQELRLLTQRMGNRRDYSLCNDLFHHKLILMSKNTMIHRIWATIEDQIRLIMLSCDTSEELHAISLSLHKDITRALELRDKAAYCRAVLNHMQVAVEHILKDYADPC